MLLRTEICCFCLLVIHSDEMNEKWGALFIIHFTPTLGAVPVKQTNPVLNHVPLFSSPLSSFVLPGFDLL